MTDCPKNKFGPGCKLTCHCLRNDTCNHVDGKCAVGRCYPGFTAAGCQWREWSLSSAGVNGRMSEAVSQLVDSQSTVCGWMDEWVKQSVSQLVDSQSTVCGWMDEWVKQSVSQLVDSLWVNGWMSEAVSQSVSRQSVGEWMNEWSSQSVS